jgi:hypothetical protein
MSTYANSARAELLAAMKESLRRLNTLESLSPDDLAILPLKRNLKAQIAEMERPAKDLRRPAVSDADTNTTGRNIPQQYTTYVVASASKVWAGTRARVNLPSFALPLLSRRES